jgi:RNA polymerase sigma factor (sigma-70 family)
MSSIDRGIVLQQLDRLFRDGTLAGLGDGQLLERYRTRRDEAAFEALVELHGPMVLGLCRRFLRDPRDIEDAFQATFLVLVRKAPLIRDGGQLANWLYGVALRVATRSRANLLRRRTREQAIGAAEFAALPDGNDVLGMGPVLDQELSRLPAKYRAPLVLCYLRGQTHDQAARELRCPVGTVRSRMARGRDLLKRRLTRQGFAPTAAIFGPGLCLPAHLLTETVPAPLVAATVEAAFAIGSSHSIQAGVAAASVLALTQGALTSMKLAQLKWIGVALVATGLSAGGAIGIAAVTAQDRAATEGPGLSIGVTAETQEAPTTRTVIKRPAGPSASTEKRLRGLEDQINQIYRLSGAVDKMHPSFDPDAPTLDRLEAKIQFLLSRHNPATTGGGANSFGTGRTTSAQKATTAAENASSITSTATSAATQPSHSASTSVSSAPATDAAAASFTSTLQTDLLQPAGAGSGTRIRELEAQLKQARLASERAEKLHASASISQSEYQEARGKVDLTLAALQGMDDDFADELDRLKLVIKKKNAELDQARAQQEVAMSVVARNNRLINRQPGIVGSDDVARAEAELRVAEAHTRVKAVEHEEPELQHRKLERWRTRVRQILDAMQKHGDIVGPHPSSEKQ